jgi:hypothetical protein
MRTLGEVVLPPLLNAIFGVEKEFGGKVWTRSVAVCEKRVWVVRSGPWGALPEAIDCVANICYQRCLSA